MIKIILSIFIAVSLAYSEEAGIKDSSCVLSQDGEIKVSFKAYKTPSKIGVGGVFDSVDFKAVSTKGKNFHEIFVGSSVVIDTSSVNSNNKGRDEKLVNFFFNQMSEKSIKAKIVDVKPNAKVKEEPYTGVFITDISMNGIIKKVPMKYSFDAGKLVATGVIDILDFSAAKALTSINKACFDLHKGKTWSDVTIGFTTNVKAVCNTK